MDAAYTACLPRLGWMPLNLRDLHKKTAGLDPIATNDYIRQQIEKFIEKHRNFHIRAKKAARKRWGLPDVSIDDAKARAASIKKLEKKTLSFVQRWVGNAQIRKDRASKAARARWDKNKPSASTDKAGQKFGSFPLSYSPLDTFREIVGYTSPLSPRELSQAFLETANFDPGTLAGLFSKGNPVAMPGANVAGPQGSFLGGLRKLVKRRSADPRYEEFKAEVLLCWSKMNPDNPECPWIRKEEKALAELMEGNPSLTLKGLQQWLLNRCHSEINRTDPPRKWLGNLVEYANGPLDRFKKPTGRRL